MEGKASVLPCPLLNGDKGAGKGGASGHGAPVLLGDDQGRVSQCRADGRLSFDGHGAVRPCDCKLARYAPRTSVCDGHILYLARPADLGGSHVGRKICLPAEHGVGGVIGNHILPLDIGFKAIVVLLAQALSSLFYLHGSQIGVFSAVSAPYACICRASAGGGEIKGLNGFILIEQHLSVSLLYSLGGLIIGRSIIIDLEICAVIHMGAILAVGISLDLAVGIGPGAHGLGLQGFLLIGRRHFAGHYLCQVILQKQIIDKNQPLRCSLDFQASAVNRRALAPLNGSDGDCLRLIRRNDHTPIFQIRAVRTNRKLRACLQALSHHLSLGILIFQISAASQHQIRRCVEHTLKAGVHQKDADGLGVKFPL